MYTAVHKVTTCFIVPQPVKRNVEPTKAEQAPGTKAEKVSGK